MSEQPEQKESPPLQEGKQESTTETKPESLAASERRQRRQKRAEEQASKERTDQSPQEKTESAQQQQVEEKKEAPPEQVQQQHIVFKQPDPQTNISEKSSQPILFGLKFQLDNLEKFIRRRTEQDLENKDLLFSLSDQRKSESLKLLKDWVKDRTDQFELSRDILEELIGGVDIRSRLSVEFLQICYKFFIEKCQHEAQYSKFLLTKPQSNFMHNSIAQTMYLQIANAISELDERNIKHQSEVSNFASRIETDILNAPIFAEFATLDEKSDTLVKSLSIQRKQLQNLLYSASSKLNQIIPLIPSSGGENQQVTQAPQGPQGYSQQNRSRKPIFDQPQPSPHQKGISDYVISGLSNFGQMFIGPFVYERQLDDSLNQSDKLERQQSMPQQSPKESPKPEQQVTEEEGKSSQKIAPPQPLERRTSEDQLKKSDQFIKSNQDMFLLIWSLIKTQDQANSLLNTVVEKFLQYWDHVNINLKSKNMKVVIVEKKRSKWINQAIVLYNNLYSEVYPQNKPIEIKTPTEKDVEDAYSLETILTPEVFAALKQRHQDISRQNIKDTLFLQSVPCQAAKILIVKEFKVSQAINHHQEIPSYLILTIDKYLGLWNLLDNQSVENVEKPIFHYPITSLQIHKVNNITVEVIPSKHLLFVNIGQEKQKIQVKFSNPDDLEEFLTVIEVQRT